MRYLRATFRGYIGFYNGMGLEVVDIDFTKSTHNIILITGINGCGKSTLINALNIFPDGSNSFIKGKDADKALLIQDLDNIYEIYIISAADDKGGRKTTKAFIKKNGVELNENGNVSSYKEIISTEFELDSNYVSLSSLSSNDRGLGDKTPAERKKFAASIIDNLEVYNDMYKNLNKKSLVYKSHINNLHTKIQNIGRKEDLEAQMVNLRNKEAAINDKIVELNNKIVTIQAKNSMDDKELQEIKEANECIEAIDNSIARLQSSLDEIQNKTRVKLDGIHNKCKNDTELLSTYEKSLSTAEANWKNAYDRLNYINSSLEEIRTEMIGFDTKNDIGDRYNKSNNTIKNIQSELKGGISNDPTDIVSLERLVEFYNKFIAYTDEFYDNLTPEDIKLIVQDYSTDTRTQIANEQTSIIKLIESKKAELIKIQDDMRVLAVLENRPTKCKIDTCPFISDAIKLKKSIKGDIVDQMDSVQKDILDISNNLTEISAKLDHYDSLFPKYMKFQAIRNYVSDHVDLLMKFNPRFLNTFDVLLSEANPFNDIRDTQFISNTKNNLILLQTEMDNNKILEVEYKAYQEKVQIINANNTRNKKLEKEKDQIQDDIVKYKTEVDSLRDLISNLRESIDNMENCIRMLDRIDEYKWDKQQYQDIIDQANVKSQKALESVSEIQGYKNDIEVLTNELKPVVDQINLYAGELTLLESYYKEYDEYKHSYDIIETIKKYCSPTGGGIQTLFMQLYMSKTLETANHVLGMLFNGEYRLLDFIINESEFRIPFIGSGMMVDDISSGSSSQISIFGMIINLVLLNQASTKFNIARLDEIDAGLDNKNRSDFINFIFYTMNILNIEQVFMISHSIEADNSNADIIKLKSYDDYESGIVSGNVIYDYNEFI